MPLYEYKCEDCGALFERLVSQTNIQTACVNCGSERVKKQFSVFAASVSHGRSGDMPPSPCGSCESPGRGQCGMV
ncbi:MAG: zinc ribbon domain-containing protein [Nitrospirae bacterium]|nr:zinc ribbon domain-containing protein [Nitrospirota bacterium]